MQVFVVGLAGASFPVSVSGEDASVEQLQRQVELAEGVPPELQRLAFQGAELRRGHTLRHYRVEKHSTLHLSMNLDGGYFPSHLELLPMWHLLNKQICRKCYGRLSASATRCNKAKCGRTTDIRPKKCFRYFRNYFKLNPQLPSI